MRIVSLLIGVFAMTSVSFAGATSASTMGMKMPTCKSKQISVYVQNGKNYKVGSSQYSAAQKNAKAGKPVAGKFACASAKMSSVGSSPTLPTH